MSVATRAVARMGVKALRATFRWLFDTWGGYVASLISLSVGVLAGVVAGPSSASLTFLLLSAIPLIGWSVKGVHLAGTQVVKHLRDMYAQEVRLIEEERSGRISGLLDRPGHDPGHENPYIRHL